MLTMFTLFILNRNWRDQQKYGSYSLAQDEPTTLFGFNYPDMAEFLIYVLFGEHVMSYIFG